MSPQFGGIEIEMLEDRRLCSPYRGIVGRTLMRLIVRRERITKIEVDDASVEVSDDAGAFSLSGIEALFVVERQPPRWCFLTWYGVFARRHGRGDKLIFETPDGKLARFIERRIEQQLGLRDVPVRGEVRCG
jgi:hypothetical protein